MKTVLTKAGKRAKLLNHPYVGIEHILLGLLAEGQSAASQALKRAGFDIEKTSVEIVTELESNVPSAQRGIALGGGSNLRFSTMNPNFGDAASNAIRYWERSRIVYNAVLGSVVLPYFFAGLPASRKSISLNGVLGFFLLALGANVLFCLAYVPDIFAQLSIYGAVWKRRRWILFIIGLAIASIFTRWISMRSFGLEQK